MVIAVGKVAETHLHWVKSVSGCPEYKLLFIPHPSTQGLLSMAEGRGKGRKVADLENEWFGRLGKLLC